MCWIPASSCTKELKKEIRALFSSDREKSSLFITVLSFGFKYGIPSDADLVFDVRVLAKPLLCGGAAVPYGDGGAGAGLLLTRRYGCGIFRKAHGPSPLPDPQV